MRNARLVLLILAGTMLYGLLGAGSVYAGPIIPNLPSLPPLQAVAQGSIATGVAGRVGQNVQGALPLTASVSDSFDMRSGQATFIASGGQVPTLTSNGAATRTSASASGTASYLFRVMPLNTLIQAPGAIPVTMTASASGNITPGSSTASGSIQAILRVDNINRGFFSLEMFQGNVTNITNSVGTVQLVVTPFAFIGVQMEILSGVRDFDGTSTFNAMLDPIFFVDPDAVFDFGSQTLNYIDHYGIAYSEGIEQWQPTSSAPVPEPSSLTLWFLGAATFIGLGWRRRERVA